MNNKLVTGAILLIIVSLLYIWYFSEADVSIVGLEAPQELGIEDIGTLEITLLNNESMDINVTINVKNSFVDDKGESLKVVQILAYENLSYMLSNATDRPHKEVRLKPGNSHITFMVGYQVPGTQKVEIEVFRKGKLADSRTVEINVLLPKVSVELSKNKGINGTLEIYSVFGNLELMGKGKAKDVIVNVSVINGTTNTTISGITRKYSFSTMERHLPLVVWSNRSSVYDEMTGMVTSTTIETMAPVAVIELSGDGPSDEKYKMSPLVMKGRTGERYEIVATASFIDQVVSSRISIP